MELVSSLSVDLELPASSVRRSKNRWSASWDVHNVPPIWIVSSFTPRKPRRAHRYSVATWACLPPLRFGSDLAASVSEITDSLMLIIILSPFTSDVLVSHRVLLFASRLTNGQVKLSE